MSAITLYYWPALGRSIAARLMLEDSGKPYERVMFDGKPLHPSVVAVPAIKLDGEYISQSMAINEALADALDYEVPAKAYNKALQAMLNIYDIHQQAVEKRVAITTKRDAAAFLNSRGKQFLTAVEASYGLFKGPLFYESEPSFVDFQLVGTIVTLRYLFGEDLVNPLLPLVCPKALDAFTVMTARPNIKAFIDGGFKGESVLPEHMKCSHTLLLPSKRVFLFAGFGHLPEVEYFPALVKHLEAKGCTVVKQSKPIEDGDVAKHVAEFNELLAKHGGPGDDCFVIGHSVGFQLAMRGVASLGEGKKVGGLVGVAAWLELSEGAKANDAMARWADHASLDLAHTQAKAGKIGLLYSSDDDSSGLGQRQVEVLKHGLPHAALHVATGRGHFHGAALTHDELAFIDATLGF